jgi:hypothetical protein
MSGLGIGMKLSGFLGMSGLGIGLKSGIPGKFKPTGRCME